MQYFASQNAFSCDCSFQTWFCFVFLFFFCFFPGLSEDGRLGGEGCLGREKAIQSQQNCTLGLQSKGVPFDWEPKMLFAETVLLFCFLSSPRKQKNNTVTGKLIFGKKTKENWRKTNDSTFRKEKNQYSHMKMHTWQPKPKKTEGKPMISFSEALKKHYNHSKI